MYQAEEADDDDADEDANEEDEATEAVRQTGQMKQTKPTRRCGGEQRQQPPVQTDLPYWRRPEQEPWTLKRPWRKGQ